MSKQEQLTDYESLLIKAQELEKLPPDFSKKVADASPLREQLGKKSDNDVIASYYDTTQVREGRKLPQMSGCD